VRTPSLARSPPRTTRFRRVGLLGTAALIGLDTDFLKHLEAEHLVWKETLTSPAPLNKPSLPPSTTTTTKKRRASVACYWCHKSKTSCGEERPCLRCVRLGLQDSCIDRPHKKRGRPAVKLEICKDEACFDPKPSDFLMFDDQLSLTSSSSPGAPPKDLPEAVRESLVSLFRDLYFQESNCSLDDTSSGELRAWYSKLSSTFAVFSPGAYDRVLQLSSDIDGIYPHRSPVVFCSRLLMAKEVASTGITPAAVLEISVSMSSSGVHGISSSIEGTCSVNSEFLSLFSAVHPEDLIHGDSFTLSSIFIDTTKVAAYIKALIKASEIPVCVVECASLDGRRIKCAIRGRIVFSQETNLVSRICFVFLPLSVVGKVAAKNDLK